MQHTEYTTLYELEDTYWWYVGRRYIIQKLLSKYVHSPESIVDIGCGTGSNLHMLSKFSDKVRGLDISEQAIAYCHDRGFQNVELIRPAEALPINGDADLVTMFDVLEHVADDRVMLSQIYTGLRPGGHLVLTVPAYQFLWSEHDEVLHHKRRYTRRQLVAKLKEQGFTIVKSSYAIVFSCPAIILYRAVKGLLNRFMVTSHHTSHVKLPNVINSFFISLLRIEGTLLQWIDFPFGTSIVVVAKK